MRGSKGRFIKGHSIPKEWKEKISKKLTGRTATLSQRHLKGRTGEKNTVRENIKNQS